MARRLALWFWMALAISAPVRAEGIVDVLERSQRMRLATFETVPQDDPRAAIVRESFERVLKASGEAVRPQLRVVTGPVWAETLLRGQVIVANEALADVSEGERVFMIAHELGHVVRGHWGELGALYLRYVPAEVTPQVTDAVAGLLGREASALSHQHEFDADAYGLALIQRMGYPIDTAIGVFLHLPVQMDTATHPGTRRRVAQLRSMQ